MCQEKYIINAGCGVKAVQVKVEGRRENRTKSVQRARARSVTGRQHGECMEVKQ